jgi:hypothetical protein
VPSRRRALPFDIGPNVNLPTCCCDDAIERCACVHLCCIAYWKRFRNSIPKTGFRMQALRSHVVASNLSCRRKNLYPKCLNVQPSRLVSSPASAPSACRQGVASRPHTLSAAPQQLGRGSSVVASASAASVPADQPKLNWKVLVYILLW